MSTHSSSRTIMSWPQQSTAESRLDANKAIAASFVRMRFDFQTADDAPAVQQLLVVAQLFHVKTGFIGKIPLDQELAGKIVVARKGP